MFETNCLTSGKKGKQCEGGVSAPYSQVDRSFIMVMNDRSVWGSLASQGSYKKKK